MPTVVKGGGHSSSKKMREMRAATRSLWHSLCTRDRRRQTNLLGDCHGTTEHFLSTLGT